jgi:hypothetical protein
MKNFILLLCFLFFGSVLNHVQAGPKLKFNDAGEFKIVQFTDTHIDLVSGSNLKSLDIIKNVLTIEKPDLVVLTGDIVTQDNPQEGFKRLADIFASFHLPWAVVFGNHESEHNFKRVQLATYLKGLPYCLNDDKSDTKGDSDFILSVYDENKKSGALLYCIDSNTYSTLKPVVDGYGWFDSQQIGWYRKNSRKFTRVNNGNPLPALAFFHIPLPEYSQAWNNKTVKPIGVKNEDECSPVINSGMFTAMLECGDVMGTFVGHDHINDYIGVYCNIALAYGRVSKVMKNPKEDPLAGGRVIVLKEGKRQFDTWIRDMDGKKVLECRWPDSFQPVMQQK